MKPNTSKVDTFIRELCKNRTEEEIIEAQENFRRYIALVKRVCERLEREEIKKNQMDT